MQNTQLVKLLEVLSAKELTQFHAYLNKVERPSNKYVAKLFLRLKKYAPTYDSPKLDRDKIALYLFNSTDTQALNKTAFTLKSILQDFLVFRELANNPILKQQLLVKALKHRNHPDYPKVSKQLIKTIQTSSDGRVDSLALFQLNYALSADANNAKIGNDLEELNFANQYLDQFYFYHKLKIILEYRIAKKINRFSWSVDQEEAILGIVEKYANLKNDPTIQLLLLAINVIVTPKKESYLRLKLGLFEKSHLLSKQDVQDIFVTLTVHYNQHLSQDFDFYIQEGFELYRFADQQNLLVINGRIRNVEYTNAASVGFSTNNEDWAHDFIERNKKFLAPNIRTALYAYTKAIFYFKKEAFNDVNKLLYPYSNDPDLALNTNILIRSLLLRNYFELYHKDVIAINQQQFIHSQSNSFERFLKSKKKLSPTKTASYLLFLHFFNQIVRLIQVPNVQKKKLLRTEISSNNNVALKGWLLSKIG